LKIRIIGPSGSGKSWLAKRLSEKTGIACHDLDSMLWDNSAGTHFNVKRDPAVRDAMLNEVTGKDEWIIEGVQYAWTGSTFEAADIIYMIIMPAPVCRMRIIRRFIRRKLTGTDRRNESLRSVIELLKWTKKFYRVNLKEIAEVLEPYKEKTKVLRSKKEIANELKKISRPE